MLASQLAQEFALVHVIFKSFPAVDKNHWHFVIEAAAQFVVAVNVDLLPGKAAMAREFCQALFDDFAKMATLAGIEYDLSGLRHVAIVTSGIHRMARKKLCPATHGCNPFRKRQE